MGIRPLPTTTTPAPVFGRRWWWVEPLFCCWEWLPIPRMVPRPSVTGAVRCVFHGRLQAALEEEGRISSAPRKAPQPTPTLLLLLVVVIPRLHCYVHPKSALVHRISWHRKMKIASTSSATWMVRPNPRKNQSKKWVRSSTLNEWLLWNGIHSFDNLETMRKRREIIRTFTI